MNLARNEEGEFELVLGNRQLVSVFLIVVVLLGVFFSMGYFVGRNTPTVIADGAAKPSTPIIVENPSKGSSGGSSGSERDNAAVRDNPPVRDNSTDENAADAKARPAPPTPPVQKPTPVAAREKPVESASKPSVGQPQSGLTFLQVVATSRPDSELIAETLAKKGFHTSIAPGPNAALFRVLVGPLNSQADMAETRVRLEAAGFRNPYKRTY